MNYNRITYFEDYGKAVMIIAMAWGIIVLFLETINRYCWRAW